MPVAHNRRQVTAFVDAAPSIRLAADLKTELFRNKSGSWKVSHLHDIDAMMIAVPYCDVVVPDKEIFSLMDRSKAGERNGAIVIRHLDDLLTCWRPRGPSESNRRGSQWMGLACPRCRIRPAATA